MFRSLAHGIALHYTYSSFFPWTFLGLDTIVRYFDSRLLPSASREPGPQPTVPHEHTVWHKFTPVLISFPHASVREWSQHAAVWTTRCDGSSQNKAYKEVALLSPKLVKRKKDSRRERKHGWALSSNCFWRLQLNKKGPTKNIYPFFIWIPQTIRTVLRRSFTVTSIYEVSDFVRVYSPAHYFLGRSTSVRL